MDVHRLQARLTAITQSLQTKKVTIGIHADAGTHDGQSIAAIANYNEFGTAAIPSRPFMRYTLASNQAQYRTIMRSIVRSVLNENYTLDQGLGRLGAKVRDDIKATIVSMRDPPNSDATIKAKGSDNPLIDTGRLVNSISFEVNDVSD